MQSDKVVQNVDVGVDGLVGWLRFDFTQLLLFRVKQSVSVSFIRDRSTSLTKCLLL